MRQCVASAPQLALVAALLVSAAVAAAATGGRPAGMPVANLVDAASVTTPMVFAETNRGMRPTKLVAYKRTHYFQIPANPIATLVFFHGCSRSAKGFFPYDPVYCPECMGFPEDVSHTKQALARGYAMLALDPNDEKNLCWSSSASNGYVNDQPDVIAAISQFLLAHNLHSKPVYFAGASSGGTIALKLHATLYLAAHAAGALSLEQASAMAENYTGSAESVGDLAAALAAAAAVTPPPQEGINGTDKVDALAAAFHLQVHGIIAEVSTPTDFGAADRDGKLRWPEYPPTVFVTMQRDTQGQSEAQTNVNFFTRNGVPSGAVMSPTRQITPTYFSDRSPVISRQQSALIVAALKAIGLLNAAGALQANPKLDTDPKSLAFQWPTKLQKALPWLETGRTARPPLSVQFRTSHIHQSLYVAWAGHEHVSDYLTACLAWLESDGLGHLPSLARQLVVPAFNLTALTPDRKQPTDPGIDPTFGRPPPPTNKPPPPSLRSPPSPRTQLSPPKQALPPSAPPPRLDSVAGFFEAGQPASPPRPPSPPSRPPSPAPRPPWPPADVILQNGGDSTSPPASPPPSGSIQRKPPPPPMPRKAKSPPPPPPRKAKSPPPPPPRKAKSPPPPPPRKAKSPPPPPPRKAKSPPPPPPRKAKPPPLPPPRKPRSPPPLRKCRDERCMECGADRVKCSDCIVGFRPSKETGQCVLACTDSKCLECRFRRSLCKRCIKGHKVVNGKCVRAAP